MGVVVADVAPPPPTDGDWRDDDRTDEVRREEDSSGSIRLDHNKPTAAITIHARSFDTTMAAVKGLGPDISAKAMPGLALAKGLAKSESDGSLSWLVELDAQRSIKINGIPFGKAPD